MTIVSPIDSAYVLSWDMDFLSVLKWDFLEEEGDGMGLGGGTPKGTHRNIKKSMKYVMNKRIIFEAVKVTSVPILETLLSGLKNSKQ